MKFRWYIFIFILPVIGMAEEWQFSRPIVVSQAVKGIFQHIDASSRRAIAVSKNTVAVVWEDNRSGTPQIYAALKKISEENFHQAIKISDKGPAYEAGISALNDGRFVIGWEAGNRLWLRVLSEHGLGEASVVSQYHSRQIALDATPDNKLVAVWAERRDKAYQIYFSNLDVNRMSVKVIGAILVDKTKVEADQAYPSVYQSNNGSIVGWEDRRFGNTRIFTSFARPGEAFSPHHLLNDFRPSRITRFGNGSGAMRIVMDGNRQSMLVASWLDKRDFEGGYDVYAAVSTDGGRTFGKDELAQDMFGENTPQWHNAVAVSNDSRVVTVWDDTRDGLSHVFLSERLAGGWGADSSLTDADEVSETHPVICFDRKGRLHVAYIERQQKGSSIMYVQSNFRSSQN